VTAFAAWLAETRTAIHTSGTATVPCNGCTACCRARQFVPIEPDETDTLAHVPPDLLFPAPRRPAGHMVLPYDERGHCALLVDDRCSIYEHRPRACRTYDCRVFAAAAIEPADAAVAARAATWAFSYPTPDDRLRHDAVRAAAAYFRDHPDQAPTTNPTQLAVLAIEIADLFLATPDPSESAVRAAVARLVRAPGDAATS
jgi:Fe-S-cluster containining protein